MGRPGRKDVIDDPPLDAPRVTGRKPPQPGVDNGVTVFTALRESPRRAVMGFYGVTDEVLTVAATARASGGRVGKRPA